ncbi:20377_t:CDS:2 [Gigaspora rosea]|nr:20377_t:CDS:2 [Gigaspora rosea]
MSKGSDINKCEDIATKVWKYNLLRTNRSLSCKGRKAKWYTLVKKELLKEEGSKEGEQPIGYKIHNWKRISDSSYRALGTRVAECNNRNDIGFLLTRPHKNSKRKLNLNVGAILRWGKRREVEDDTILELLQRLKEVQDLEIEVIRN